jgi:hypothetical protein
MVMGLDRTANKCLLSGKKEEQCIEEVRKNMHEFLESSLKDMQNFKKVFSELFFSYLPVLTVLTFGM